MRVDLHMHTGYSADADFPQTIDDKIAACERAGLDIIGLTDHLDFYRRIPPAENRDAEACVREAWEKRRPAGNGGIEVLAGIEIGQIHADRVGHILLEQSAAFRAGVRTGRIVSLIDKNLDRQSITSSCQPMRRCSEASVLDGQHTPCYPVRKEGGSI